MCLSSKQTSAFHQAWAGEPPQVQCQLGLHFKFQPGLYKEKLQGMGVYLLFHIIKYSISRLPFSFQLSLSISSLYKRLKTRTKKRDKLCFKSDPCHLLATWQIIGTITNWSGLQFSHLQYHSLKVKQPPKKKKKWEIFSVTQAKVRAVSQCY